LLGAIPSEELRNAWFTRSVSIASGLSAVEFALALKTGGDVEYLGGG
jgi:hypothetical protein